MVSNGAKRLRTAVEENVDQLDHENVFVSIEKLQEAQDELDKINVEASDKVLAIEKIYNEIREPIYIRRNKIISLIPDFWLTSFLNHPTLGDLLNEEDRKIFKYMESLNVENFKDVKRGYGITFNFKANPYFENDELSKSIKFSDDGTLRSTGTTIKWKLGKALADASGSVTKEGNKRPLPPNSFFNWFSLRPEDALEVDQDSVAELIKEELWPNPIGHLNNDDDEDDDEDEDDTDTDDDEDDDDEDDELDEEGEDDGSGKGDE